MRWCRFVVTVILGEEFLSGGSGRVGAGFEVGEELAAVAADGELSAWSANVHGGSGAGERDDRCHWQDAHDGEGRIGLKTDVALRGRLLLHEMIPPEL
jgi:hypothetical protein